MASSSSSVALSKSKLVAVRLRRTKRKKEEKPPRVIESDIVSEAVSSLMNTAKRTFVIVERKSDTKNGYDTPTCSDELKFDPEVLKTWRGILSGRKDTMMFRLVRTGTLTTGAASFNVFVSTALSNYAEGAALTALFDECKMISSQMEIIVENTITGTTAFTFAVGFQNRQDLIAPSYTQVNRLPQSRLRIAYPGVMNIDHLEFRATNVLRDRVWGLTVADLASTSTSLLSSGCLGQYVVSASGATTVPTSTLAFTYRIITIAKLRCKT